jgi:hypothetical protein
MAADQPSAAFRQRKRECPTSGSASAVHSFSRSEPVFLTGVESAWLTVAGGAEGRASGVCSTRSVAGCVVENRRNGRSGSGDNVSAQSVWGAPKGRYQAELEADGAEISGFAGESGNGEKDEWGFVDHVGNV